MKKLAVLIFVILAACSSGKVENALTEPEKFGFSATECVESQKGWCYSVSGTNVCAVSLDKCLSARAQDSFNETICDSVSDKGIRTSCHNHFEAYNKKSL